MICQNEPKMLYLTFYHSRTYLQIFWQPPGPFAVVVGEEEPVAVFQDPELLSDEEGEGGAERRA